jgi:hypothetical protein
MASSGWQGQKDIQTSKYPHMALNLNVWDVVHSGSTLTFKATVRAVVTSGNIYYNGVTVSLTGGGSITKNMNPVSAGGYVDFGTFNCTVTNVSASTTSYNIAASLSAGSVASGSASWSINIGSGGSAPTGLSVIYKSSTWNSVSTTVTLQHWGGVAGSRMSTYFVTGSSASDFLTVNSSNWKSKGRYVWNINTTAYSTDFNNLTQQGATAYADSPRSMQGLVHYYLGCRADNSVGLVTEMLDTSVVRYLPPAPPQFSYTDPGGQGAKVYPVAFAGVAANNASVYDTANLTRTIRYRIGNGSWVYVDNDTVAAVDLVTNFSVTVPVGSTATIEGWMTYHGMQSEIRTITLSNTSSSVALYGSVNGGTKKLGPVYASVNGRTRKLKKIYASVGGVTKKVYEDV